MLQIFPFLAWLAPVTSAVLIILLWDLGELGRGALAVLLTWFLLAGWCQFFAGSAVVSAAGLLLQTILAISLFFRWKLSG